ncbi:MAG: hypothetical protein DUD39_09330 [Coriobacteriaceae bacterium]|nr:MAG: hypothetical protein DUD39_09330 [Coriobacteriaceae bacterium]
MSEDLDDACLPDGLRLRHLLERTTADLNGGGRGLVLLVDDAQKAKKDELALLTECVQYEIGKRHDIALVPAGTRESMLACADGAGMGSVSRAKTEDLRVIPEDESAPALEEALLAAGLAIEGGVLPQLLDAAQGHAALLQWHLAQPCIPASGCEHHFRMRTALCPRSAGKAVTKASWGSLSSCSCTPLCPGQEQKAAGAWLCDSGAA